MKSIHSFLNPKKKCIHKIWIHNDVRKFFPAHPLKKCKNYQLYNSYKALAWDVFRNIDKG